MPEGQVKRRRSDARRGARKDAAIHSSPILVTGGAGYIGSHVVLALRDAGQDVVVIDNLSTGSRDAVPPEVPFYNADIGDAPAVLQVLLKHDIRAIMHFAGSIIVPESVQRPLDYYHNNTVRSRTLLQCAVELGIRHFVFSSTAAVYGMPRSTPIREGSRKVPINPYGMSKLMTEQMLADVAKAHPLNFSVLRYFNVAGADPLGRTGQRGKGSTHLIKVAVEAALGKRSGVDIFGMDYATPDGTGVRDYIHVTDLANAHVEALRALCDYPRRNMILNCGYGRGFSVIEVLDAVDRVAARPVQRRFADRRPGDPDKLIADTRLIRKILDWNPTFDHLDDIVRDALRWEASLIWP